LGAYSRGAGRRIPVTGIDTSSKKPCQSEPWEELVSQFRRRANFGASPKLPAAQIRDLAALRWLAGGGIGHPLQAGRGR
jgi:hypothetical protein